jgi:CDP-diacylglycerol--serine O-phosphatidyltransferase
MPKFPAAAPRLASIWQRRRRCRALPLARRARGEDLDRPRHRGIYLLPNAFTTAALFCGFYAIVMAMNLKFEHAAWAISSP